MRKQYYLAYGSNLNVGQMRYRCPDAKAIGTAEIPGYELLFKGSKTGAYLTIEEQDESKVPVAVWEVSERDERNLDIYEGFPNFYYKRRFRVKVTGKDGEQKEIVAFAYIMHEDRLVAVPSEQYYITCRNGYKTFGFDLKYLNTALEKSWLVEAIRGGEGYES